MNHVQFLHSYGVQILHLPGGQYLHPGGPNAVFSVWAGGVICIQAIRQILHLRQRENFALRLECNYCTQALMQKLHVGGSIL